VRTTSSWNSTTGISLKEPADIANDSEGSVLVADTGNHRAQEWECF
jgi:hypothetical protein